VEIFGFWQAGFRRLLASCGGYVEVGGAAIWGARREVRVANQVGMIAGPRSMHYTPEIDGRVLWEPAANGEA